MGTKANPAPHDAYAKAEDDEPMFTLLARDPMAPTLVRRWAQARELQARSDEDREKGAEARRCAEAMERWAEDHPDRGFRPEHG